MRYLITHIHHTRRAEPCTVGGTHRLLAEEEEVEVEGEEGEEEVVEVEEEEREEEVVEVEEEERE